MLKIVLISTYELGRQPFGLASPAAWLRADGHIRLRPSTWLAVRPARSAVQEAGLDRLLPAHAHRDAAGSAAIEKVRTLNPAAHLCCYGLYAPMNAPYLRELGVKTVLGGEFEQGLRDLAGRLAVGAKTVRSASH